ncbi:MAG: hypothetical protein IMZ67_07250 [Acidobacteria bacterium]|nr:hypothetical protein [Acidobacteriota bacterium]
MAKSANDLLVEALAKLEDALVAKASETGVTSKLEREFAQYQKVKAHVLANANAHEARNALRLALVSAIRMVV